MNLFIDCKIQYIGRLRNEFAHKLVRYAWHVNDVIIWWDSVPDFILPVIWTDKNM